MDVVLPGKWKRGEEIGRGGFGRVYAGFVYGESPMLIAIKELEAKGQDSAKDVAEFANEIDVMRRLRHPNIVRCVSCHPHMLLNQPAPLLTYIRF